MPADNISKILEKIEGFDWNKGNIDKNWQKHKVSSKEAEEIFLNKPLILFEDEKHSTKKEKRYGVFGRAKNKKRLTVIFTVRSKKIRIISARKMSRKERKSYEQK